MPLDHEELLSLHDKAYNNGYDTRLKAADDMIFAWITQWDDTYLSETDLGYRGEFNILRKAQRQITADLIINPVTVDFEPMDDSDEGGADIIDGMYRAAMRNNMSLEAKENATQETIVCGYGAWELRNEYRTNKAGDERQVIRRYPLWEANNNVMWDPNAKAKDKSDAMYVSCLVAYSEDGYLQLKEDLGKKDGIVDGSFSTPETSYVFPWISETKKVYVTRFFHRELKTVKYHTFKDDFNGEKMISEDDLDEAEDDLVDQGYNLDSTRSIKRYVVTRYIASGEGILEAVVIPGEHLPVIPQYGERSFVEGEEHYEGIIRLAKDPQRLRNFQLSYLADITSMSPREKPIFTQEQIGGYEDMYDRSGADNNLPYLLQNSTDADGNALPVGPVGYIKAPEVPQALTQSIAESRAAVDDVAGVGLPQNITDTDLSNKAIQSLQKRFDMQSYTYQNNHKHAMRRDGEVWASMASDVYDTEQSVTLLKKDNKTTTTTINRQSLDFSTMTNVVENDLTVMSFEVYATVGASFETVKDQTKEEVKELLNGTQSGTPEYTMLLNTYLMLLDGDSFEDIRTYARKQLILTGIKDPETKEDEDMLALQQEQSDNQEDPLALEGQARIMEGQAALQNEENDANKIIVDEFNAITNRQKVEILAAEAGVKITDIQVSTIGKKIDNTLKLRAAIG